MVGTGEQDHFGVGRALGRGGEQGDRQKRLAVKERHSSWAERRQRTLCFRHGEGAIVGKAAVFNNDKGHRGQILQGQNIYHWIFIARVKKQNSTE